MLSTARNPLVQINRPAFGLVKWLLALDQAYRDRQVLRSLDPHLLKDVGLSRSDADRAFRGRFGANRWTPREW